MRRLFAISGSLLPVVLWACLQPPVTLPGRSETGNLDGSTDPGDGGGAALVGLFTITGCSELSFPSGQPRCVGVTPLRVQLVRLTVGASSHRWQVAPLGSTVDGGAGAMDLGPPADAGSSDGGASDGGSSGVILTDEQSRSDAPTVTFELPGTYQVSLGVAGPGGTASQSGLIVADPSPLGGSCQRDAHCQNGLRCFCAGEQAKTDGACPGGLRGGICSQSCDGKSCPAGSLCADLTRSVASPEPWRGPLCVAACTDTVGCRADFRCRDLPSLPPGGRAGGPFSWGRACFAGSPKAVGESCLAPDGTPDASQCVGGICEPLGLRGLCSAACPSSCPREAACATFTGTMAPAPAMPRCLARCDSLRPCTDPLLSCQTAVAVGALGFQLPGEPDGTTVCAPRRCAAPADCPSGRCVSLGAASFCLR